MIHNPCIKNGVVWTDLAGFTRRGDLFFEDGVFSIRGNNGVFPTFSSETPDIDYVSIKKATQRDNYEDFVIDSGFEVSQEVIDHIEKYYRNHPVYEALYKSLSGRST